MECRRAKVPAWSAGLFVCVVAMAPVAHAANLAKAIDSVRLTFRWPDNIKGEVTYKIKQLKTSGSHTQELGASGSYSLETQRVNDGLLVRVGNPRISTTEIGVPPGLRANIQKFFLRSTVTLPNFVVTGSGQLVRLEGVGQYQRKTESDLRKLLSQYPEDVHQRIVDAAMKLMSATRLRAMVEGNWKRDVADWSAAEFNRGDVYEMRRNIRPPVLGGTEVPVIATARFLDRIPCGSGARPKSCVRLQMRAIVDSKALARSRQSYIEQVERGGGAKPLVMTFRSTLTVWLVTEPDTLIPHRMRSRKETAIVTVTGGLEQASQGVEEIEMAYKYQADAGVNPASDP